MALDEPDHRTRLWSVRVSDFGPKGIKTEKPASTTMSPDPECKTNKNSPPEARRSPLFGPTRPSARPPWGARSWSPRHEGQRYDHPDSEGHHTAEKLQEAWQRERHWSGSSWVLAREASARPDIKFSVGLRRRSTHGKKNYAKDSLLVSGYQTPLTPVFVWDERARASTSSSASGPPPHGTMLHRRRTSRGYEANVGAGHAGDSIIDAS